MQIFLASEEFIKGASSSVYQITNTETTIAEIEEKVWSKFDVALTRYDDPMGKLFFYQLQ